MNLSMPSSTYSLGSPLEALAFNQPRNAADSESHVRARDSDSGRPAGEDIWAQFDALKVDLKHEEWAGSPRRPVNATKELDRLARLEVIEAWKTVSDPLLDRLMQATAHQVVNILLRSPLHHGTHRSADDNGRLAANAHDRIDSLPRRKGDKRPDQLSRIGTRLTTHPRSSFVGLHYRCHIAIYHYD